ncbi:hypothetical protein BUALT_Bualt16G0020700 [Buddleja alternifolia]|uniref:Uncharacterized protein n=1 Tax=Buddleja alternifolia TaxID=168488 RepID=A0AAV6W8B9_9LAMI|nr:hypothetical protein BUALT_Bualt16G0020700 [Buddleja alternifolia]
MKPLNHLIIVENEGTQTYPTVSSLLRRIAAVESALRRRHSVTPTPPPPDPSVTLQPPFKPTSEPSFCAAMNLHLKLDTIQGADPMIVNGQSSISRELNKFLNNVKPNICNSDRKIGNMKSWGLKRVNREKLRDLVERIDQLAEGLDEEECEVNENLYTYTIRKQGVQPIAKKNVSFAENKKVYRVLRRHCKPFLDEDCDDSIYKESLIDNSKRGFENDIC